MKNVGVRIHINGDKADGEQPTGYFGFKRNRTARGSTSRSYEGSSGASAEIPAERLLINTRELVE